MKLRTVAPTRFDPFADFGLFGEWARPLGAPHFARATSTNAGAVWRPPVDIAETPEAYAISVELPGSEKDDVSVEYHDNVLTIKGEKKAGEIAEGDRRHQVERVYGSFTRAFTLPNDAEGDAVKANFRNGVLTVIVPKAEQRKPKVVEIDA